MRHTALDRHARTYFNRVLGTQVPIEERNDFEIERGRIAFGGAQTFSEALKRAQKSTETE